MKEKLLIIIRRVVYNILYKVNIPLNLEENIFIYCYHSVDSDKWNHGVDFKTLKKQINYLNKNFKPGSIEDLDEVINRGKKFKNPRFIVSFDDGYEDIYKTKPYFKKMGIKPILFILADQKKVNRFELDNNKKHLNKTQILSLYEDGWIIGCHSMTHRLFKSLDDESCEVEITLAKEKIEKDLGININLFAYPKGLYNNKIVKKVKSSGYKFAFSLDNEIIGSKTDPFAIPRTGIVRTHSFEEFKSLHNPLSVLARKFAIQKLKITI